MRAAKLIQTLSPIDGSVYVERAYASAAQVDNALAQAKQAQTHWQGVPVDRRQIILRRALDAFVEQGADIAQEITQQMGRPIAHSPSEVRGFVQRASYMIDIAPQALAAIQPTAQTGFTRFIRREALGVVAVIAPWNYPYLTSVNAVIPALMAGNSVILKASHQTPLCAERYAQIFEQAELPAGCFQFLHLDHGQTERLLADERIDFVSFTGSVSGGRAVRNALTHRFIGMGLELGGKDPAYVRADANLAQAVENLVDGSFFNAGQSCCGIKRLYVHRDIYPEFVEAFVQLTHKYQLDNPLLPGTTLGPVVRPAAADFLHAQIKEALAQGAQALIDAKHFPMAQPGTAYMAPQVLSQVNHGMRVMREESFGPLVGIMHVASDQEAISLMNDSAYGLTASLWTRDEQAALQLGEQLAAGTVFMNRCDYLDPALAWTGVKHSGLGCSLSSVGYEQLTRPKSFHLRTV